MLARQEWLASVWKEKRVLGVAAVNLLSRQRWTYCLQPVAIGPQRPSHPRLSAHRFVSDSQQHIRQFVVVPAENCVDCAFVFPRAANSLALISAASGGLTRRDDDPLAAAKPEMTRS